jgi:hypothetical protein
MPLKDFRSIHLPYCIDRQKDGSYVVLNREYKPIGFKTKKTVKYDDFPIAVHFKGLTARVATKVSFKGSEKLDRIYLYDDGCIPTDGAEHMKSYLARLAVLAKLTVKEPGH